jgi:hypothetical protein
MARSSPFVFDILAHPKAQGSIHQPKDRHRREEREAERHADGHRLPRDLREASVRSGRVHRKAREHPGEQRTHDAADHVHANHVERIVQSEPSLELDRQEAHHAGGEADQQSRQRRDVAGGRRDGHEAGDGTCCRADRGRALVSKDARARAIPSMPPAAPRWVATNALEASRPPTARCRR